MTKVTLPRTNQTGANEFSDVESNDNAIIEVVNGNIDNENIKASAGIVASKLAADAKPLTWYTPKVIATEQTRESTSFGTLSTADEITGVVVPENGLIIIGYRALWKSSVSGAGRAAVFLGSNQLKVALGTGAAPAAQEASITSGATSNFVYVGSYWGGLERSSEAVGGAAFVTTGQVLGPLQAASGVTIVTAAAGTYTISVQYKATSGSVTAKERSLWVATLGS